MYLSCSWQRKKIVTFFNVINPTNYSYIITFNHKEGKQKYFHSNNIDFISKELITEGCSEFNLCNIVLTIETKSIEEYTPDLEISIRQMDNNPYYLSKRIVKQNFNQQILCLIYSLLLEKMIMGILILISLEVVD